MLIRLIEEDVEETFLTQLGNSPKMGAAGRRGIMFCRFSLTTGKVDSLSLLPAVKDILEDYHGELFFFANGDVIVAWRGNYTAIISALKTSLRLYFARLLEPFADGDFFQFYDSFVEGEKLRSYFLEKVKGQGLPRNTAMSSLMAADDVIAVPALLAAFSSSQQRAFRRHHNFRRVRKDLEILVVEDQDFSRKLLLGMLEKHYVCHAASTAVEAIELYAMTAPDIVFLDVELPDINGHELARFFRTEDKHSFVVMVTGNNCVKDVDIAKKNKVQGFIAKPYNRQKIQDAIDTYGKIRKSGGVL